MGVNEEPDEQADHSPATSVILEDEIMSKETRGGSITDNSSVETEKPLLDKSSEETSIEENSVTNEGQ